MMLRKLCRIAPLAGMALSGALACGGDNAGSRHVELNFAAMVGAAPFACEQSYMLGTPATQVTPRDFRLYVYDVALVRADGTQVPVKLDTDGKYQVSNIALLDFEDKAGDCDGDVATNSKIVGSVDEHDDYTGVHFRIGLPTALNHLDRATQPAPLNVVAMYWTWQDGHILLANEWKTPTNLAWQFRVAESLYESTDGKGCTGSHAAGYTCPNSFQPIVNLAGFDVVKDTVKLDLAPFYSAIDFTRTDFTPITQSPSADDAANASIDYQPGCHTDEWDQECISMFSVLGIDYLARGMPDPSKQSFASKL
jgi:uncharacterized repeat protein (TIGR04052 family)